MWDVLAADASSCRVSSKTPGVIASESGIPMSLRQVKGNIVWLNFPQLWFARKRARTGELLKYGGNDKPNNHGAAEGWKNMLAHFVSKGAASWDSDDHKYVLLRCSLGRGWLKDVLVSDAALDKYGSLPESQIA